LLGHCQFGMLRVLVDVLDPDVTNLDLAIVRVDVDGLACQLPVHNPMLV
jgi:hypothetical protein